MKHSLPQSDLSLLALQYAADELTAAETADFERRLADDLDAQSALAQAVQIASALQAPSTAPVIVAQPAHALAGGRSRRWSPWLAVVSSSAVAVAVMVALREESVPDAASGTLAENLATGSMVAGWTAVELESSDLLTTDDAALLGLDDESCTPEEVPDWLLAAVAIGDAPLDADVDQPASGDGLDAIDEDS